MAFRRVSASFTQVSVLWLVKHFLRCCCLYVEQSHLQVSIHQSDFILKRFGSEMSTILARLFFSTSFFIRHSLKLWDCIWLHPGGCFYKISAPSSTVSNLLRCLLCFGSFHYIQASSFAMKTLFYDNTHPSVYLLRSHCWCSFLMFLPLYKSIAFQHLQHRWGSPRMPLRGSLQEKVSFRRVLFGRGDFWGGEEGRFRVPGYPKSMVILVRCWRDRCLEEDGMAVNSERWPALTLKRVIAVYVYAFAKEGRTNSSLLTQAQECLMFDSC